MNISVIKITLICSSLFGIPLTMCTNETELDRLKKAFDTNKNEFEFWINNKKFQMRLITPGDLYLTNDADKIVTKKFEASKGKIKITKPYYIGKFEVTQAQYLELLSKKDFEYTGNDYPMSDISLSEAKEFCALLSKRMNFQVTLPTEAQWEYACRGKNKTRFIAGDDFSSLDNHAWYNDNSKGSIQKVGLKLPNQWGIYDILGNVYEPCIDDISDLDTLTSIDPVGAISEDEGIMRGGCWHSIPESCRISSRMPTDPKFGGMGIRIVINPVKTK